MPYKKFYEILKNDQDKGPFTDEYYEFFAEHNLYLYLLEREYVYKQTDNSANKKILMMNKLNYARIIFELCAIGKTLEENNIQYLVVKGIGISQTYPEPFTRAMGDHDILVRPRDFENAKKALAQINYFGEKNSSTFKDVTLFKKGEKKVELHHALFDVGIESFAACFTEQLWENPMRLDLNGGTILVPKPEFHFRYIILHMMRHLKVVGFGLRFLLDIKYFSIFYKIDLEKELEFFEEIGYGKFYKGIMSLCHYEIGMPVESVKWFYKKDTMVIQLLAEYLTEGGVFGKNSEKYRINERNIKFDDKIVGNNKMEILLRIIFPPKDVMEKEYSYIGECWWLLPIAWVNRLFMMAFDKKIELREKMFFLKRDEVFISKKIYMMKMLGLREEE